MSSTIPRKAVIPAAGRGTRVRAIAGNLPKELLSVGSKPLVVTAVEGLSAAGIREIAVVISPEKEIIRKLLIGDLPEYAGPGLEPYLKVIFRSCRFAFFNQPRPLGVADAVGRCAAFVGDEPFALVFPDNVLLDGLPVILQLIPFFSEQQTHIIGALRLSPEQLRRFGNVGLLRTEPLGPPGTRLHRVLEYSAKLPGRAVVDADQRWVLKSFGGGIYLPSYFDWIEKTRAEAGDGEVDDVPVIQALCQHEGVLAVELFGVGFDVGNPEGYWAANLHVEGR